ncbi:MAG: hypothetical protein QME14_07785 [Methanobacteriaceae archaeon]|nr:hypothetical protein [Methanobacteriaceae archaeon]
MNKNLKIGLFGFLIWLIPFLVSFFIYPLKDLMRPLFESIMPLVLTIVVVIFAYKFMKNLNSNFLYEGIKIGLAWFIINIVIDLFMFIPPSHMQMGFADYIADIGITYLIIPTITIGFGYLMDYKL